MPYPGKSEGGWKEQEGLGEENIWAGPLVGSHCVFKRLPSSGTPIICGCPVREAQKPEQHLLLLPPPPPALSLPLPLISHPLYYRQHLQPFYAGRSQSCREWCSLVTCAQPATQQPRSQPRSRSRRSGQDGEEEEPGRERAGVRERNPVPHPDLPVEADQVWRHSLD